MVALNDRVADLIKSCDADGRSARRLCAEARKVGDGDLALDCACIGGTHGVLSLDGLSPLHASWHSLCLGAS